MNNPADSLTTTLCRFAAETTFESLPEAVIHETKRLTLDLIGDAIAGSDCELGRIAIAYAERMGGHTRATQIGNGRRTSPALAAHVNARCADALDFTDTFMNWYHIAPEAVFPALAVAEDNGRSGREFLTAAALGTELGIRLSLAAGDPAVPAAPGQPARSASGRGAIMPDYLFAATAAAARARGLDAATMAHAFGIAGTGALHGQSSRWMELPALPLLKYGDVGLDAELGVYAAEMAALGLTAHPAILDGANPLWRIRRLDGFDAAAVVRDLGNRWYMLDNTYKPWPACRFTQHALTAFSGVVDKHGLKADEIERVVVRTHPWATGTHWFADTEPDGIVSCEFNIPHTIAMVALGVTRGPAWYSAATLSDGRVKALRRKVEVVPEESCRDPRQWYVDGQVGRLPTRVIVTARGRDFEGYTEYAGGDPRHPDTLMSDAALVAKFRDAVSHRGDASSRWERRAAAAADMVFGLDRAASVSSVIQRLARSLRRTGEPGGP